MFAICRDIIYKFGRMTFEREEFEPLEDGEDLREVVRCAWADVINYMEKWASKESPRRFHVILVWT